MGNESACYYYFKDVRIREYPAVDGREFHHQKGCCGHRKKYVEIYKFSLIILNIIVLFDLAHERETSGSNFLILFSI